MMWKNMVRQILAVVCAVTFSVASWALDLDSAKSQGLVGEKDTGYLGVVKDAPGVAALVSDINQRRRAKYAEIAGKRGTDRQAVEALAGRKSIEKTPSGYFIDTGSGWTQK